MKSIKELYRIGTVPSSSHTMGPRKAAEMFLTRHPEAASFKVTLYGSLAATGKGHMTDVAIIDTLKPTAPVDIIWQPKIFLPFHPNGMNFVALDAGGNEHPAQLFQQAGAHRTAEIRIVNFGCFHGVFSSHILPAASAARSLFCSGNTT